MCCLRWSCHTYTHLVHRLAPRVDALSHLNPLVDDESKTHRSDRVSPEAQPARCIYIVSRGGRHAGLVGSLTGYTSAGRAHISQPRLLRGLCKVASGNWLVLFPSTLLVTDPSSVREAIHFPTFAPVQPTKTSTRVPAFSTQCPHAEQLGYP